MGWHMICCPDCGWHTTHTTAVAASAYWAQHYLADHTPPESA